MRLYYFEFTNGTHSSDGGVLDLANDQAARLEAELDAHELLRGPGEGDWSQWTIRVTDEAGRLVASVSLSDMAEQYAGPVAMI
jgi:hypothetical protein